MATNRKKRVAALTLVGALALGCAFATLGGPGGFLTPGPDATRASPGTFATGAAVFDHNTGVLGDSDSDGTLSGSERTDLTTVQTATATVSRDVVATKGVSTLLMTPAGDDWWHLVTGLSAQAGLYDLPAPTGVDWYAYTEGRAYHSLSSVDGVYDAVHLVFTDEAALHAWVNSAALRGLTGSSTFQVRGRVLTIVPVWVDASREPFGAVDDQALAEVKVPVAIWDFNVSQWVANRASESVLPADYRQFWDHLGFARTGATWSATSAEPNAVWTGPLTGFDATKVDAALAAGILNYSMFHCTSTSDCNDEQGLSDAINSVWVADRFGGAGEDLLIPQLAPPDAEMVINMTSDFRGSITGSTGKNYSPLGTLAMWVTDDGLMSVQPVAGNSPV